MYGGGGRERREGDVTIGGCVGGWANVMDTLPRFAVTAIFPAPRMLDVEIKIRRI